MSHIKIDKTKCNGCERCVKTCNYNAIKMVNGIAVMDQSLCTICKACITECKREAITITKLIKKGIIIAGAPQTIYGRLNPNVYSAGRDLKKTGLIFLQDMLPETALIKLSWILGHTTWARDKQKVKQKLLENISGEITDEVGFGF